MVRESGMFFFVSLSCIGKKILSLPAVPENGVAGCMTGNGITIGNVVN